MSTSLARKSFCQSLLLTRDKGDVHRPARICLRVDLSPLKKNVSLLLCASGTEERTRENLPDLITSASRELMLSADFFWRFWTTAETAIVLRCVSRDAGAREGLTRWKVGLRTKRRALRFFREGQLSKLES